MDRQIVYPGAIPLDTDVLFAQQSAMIALGNLVQAAFGTAAMATGLVCDPTSPASLSVTVGPGSLTALLTVEPNAYGSLGTDSDGLMKMGINTEYTPLTFAAPGSSGQTINYLIQAAFDEVDGSPLVLPYYNAAAPTIGFSGPGNAGTAQNTRRFQRVAIQVKNGAAANAGSQLTPAVDPNYVGLYVISVSYGQSAITAANIAVCPGAPFGDPKLTGLGTRSGRLVDVQHISTSSTYVTPVDARYLIAYLYGAGGAGGGAYQVTSGAFSVGSGGASGSFAKALIYNPSATIPAIVGAGGVGVPGAAGGTGGSTSFGAYATAPGGGGGPEVATSGGNTACCQQGAPGGTPTGSALLIACNGQVGLCGFIFPNVGAFSGQGAASALGGGGGVNTNNGAGGGATSPGAGGGGAANSAAGGNLPGGAGGSGFLIVEAYS